MYLKYFLESGIFAQDSKGSESRTLFYFVTDPSRITLCNAVYFYFYNRLWEYNLFTVDRAKNSELDL